MKLSDFDYDLPQELIAQTPAQPRDSARLLVVDKTSGNMQDKIFADIWDMLWDNDVLVVNETRVIKARLKWTLSWVTHNCEIFLHTQISENTWDCLVYPGKKLKPGTKVSFAQPRSLSKGQEKEEGTWLNWNWSGVESMILNAEIKSVSESGRIVEFSKTGQDFFDAIEILGETPLPPYIKNSQAPDDRYQTVYNNTGKAGSVAAPTAGLHFTPELIEKLERKWVKIEKVCLHVWLWTFMNVEVENIQDHTMHCEQIYIWKEVSTRLNTYKSQGKRIIAVGTTSVRTLESFTNSQWIIMHWKTDTNIFIYPWYKWKFVDALITNFHLPKSTLLMLVSSFIGDENRKRVYQHAVDSKYRFFSFWDAMFLK